jgi:hypothetical protein
VTDVAVGDPVVFRDRLVPLTVKGPALPSDALPAPIRVTDSDPLLHAAGIEVRATDVTTPAVEVHDSPMPVNVPQELTAAEPPLIVFGFGATGPAAAAPGMATAMQVSPTTAVLRRIFSSPRDGDGRGGDLVARDR